MWRTAATEITLLLQKQQVKGQASTFIEQVRTKESADTTHLALRWEIYVLKAQCVTFEGIYWYEMEYKVHMFVFS